MAEKVILKIMKCPTCGADLKVENSTEPINCVYCGNTVMPVIESSVNRQSESGGFNGVLKVEGIKTSSSALAYIEQFFEDYDWDAFSYAQSLCITTIDKLVSSLKISSADDKNTWFACFKSVAVPYLHKITGCQKILEETVNEYKYNNLDAYSKFDAYKRIATMVFAQKDETIKNLEKFVAKAEKYGATEAEIKILNTEIQQIKDVAITTVYSDIENVPEIVAYNKDKNEKIATDLAAKGIDAAAQYENAKRLISEKKYVYALNVLLSLNGYSDSKTLIEKIDKYYLIYNVLEIEGVLYYYSKDSEESTTLNLYPTVDGKIAKKPIIKNIGKIITNYADVIYYLNGENKLMKYSFSTNTKEKIDDKTYSKKQIFLRERKVFLAGKKVDDYSSSSKEIVALDLKTGTVTTLVFKVREILSLIDNKLVYTHPLKEADNQIKTSLSVLDVDALSVTVFGTQKVAIEGFVGDFAVFTKQAPDEFNKNLFIKKLGSNQPEKLLEANIYHFCDIISGKIFYYIGSARNKSLININADGTERKEWPLFISNLLFEQGGWVYFIRKSGYNSVLCKSCLDGSKFSIIAKDIDHFINIKNGYLYYINSSSDLVKVRMDGSNLQILCDDVEKVLSVKEDKIVFVSIDGRIKTSDVLNTVKTIKSIYSVSFTGCGKIKLAYDITSAGEYDENTVYYVASNKVENAEGDFDTKETLYKINVENNSIDKLLDLQTAAKDRDVPTFTIAMIVMSVALFLSFVSMLMNSIVLLLFFGMVGVCALLYGLYVKFGDKIKEMLL